MIAAEVSDLFADTVHYNRPPSTFQACVLHHPKTGVPTLGSAWWGYTPAWATDRQRAQINARSETAGTKRMFAKAYVQRPCLIPADWWFEWQHGQNHKTPYAIRAADGQPFFLAGLWSQAKSLPSDDPAAGRVTFAILTGKPSADIAPIHSRQPQALMLAGARHWLDNTLSASERDELLNTQRIEAYECWPIDKRVGNPANDDASILTPNTNS
jgi:putative SOS response-associated peptidase YedK